MQLLAVSRIVLGVIAGVIAATMVLAHTLPDLGITSYRETPSNAFERPQFIEARGVLREYNEEAGTIVTDIASPYDSTATISLQVQIDDKTHIESNEELQGPEQTPATLYRTKRVGKTALNTQGALLYMLLAPKEDGFYASTLRILKSV
jgi:hypothetical protein